MAIDGKGQTPQKLNEARSRTDLKDLVNVLVEEFDVGLDKKAVDDLLYTPPEPRPSAEIQLELSDAESKLEKAIARESSPSTIKKRQAKVDTLTKQLEESLVAEDEARNAVEDDFGQSLKTLGQLATNVGNAAVGLYLRGDGKDYAPILDGKDPIGISPSADKRKAKALYKALDKLDSNKTLGKVGSPRATQSLIGALLGASVSLGTPKATQRLMDMSDDPEAARKIVLDSADEAVALGDAQSVQNVVDTVGADAVKAKHPDIASKVVKNHKPDPKKSSSENAGILVNLMNTLGVDWSKPSTYAGANSKTRRLLKNPSVNGSVERAIQMTVYDDVGKG